MNAMMILFLLILIGGSFLLIAFSIIMHYMSNWRSGGRGASRSELAQIQEELQTIRQEITKLRERQADITILIDDLTRSRLER